MIICYDTVSEIGDECCCDASACFCDSSLIATEKPTIMLPSQLLRTALNDSVSITSKLAANQRAALEQVLFFNENQYRVRDGIEQSIATYGVPEIYEQDGHLRIRVGTTEGVQSLFAVSADGAPLGVAVFVRVAEDRFVILHLGVAAPAGDRANSLILIKLMHEIRGAARRTRGVDRIELVYKDRNPMRLHGAMRMPG
jgi:hypothetical protein